MIIILLCTITLKCINQHQYKPSGKHSVFRSDTVKRTVFKTERDHTSTFSFLHQQIKGEILNEIIGVERQRLQFIVEGFKKFEKMKSVRCY